MTFAETWSSSACRVLYWRSHLYDYYYESLGALVGLKILLLLACYLLQNVCLLMFSFYQLSELFSNIMLLTFYVTSHSTFLGC